MRFNKTKGKNLAKKYKKLAEYKQTILIWQNPRRIYLKFYQNHKTIAFFKILIITSGVFKAS